MPSSKKLNVAQAIETPPYQIKQEVLEEQG